MKNILVVFLFLSIGFISRAQPYDSLKFHHRNVIYFISEIGSAGFHYNDPVTKEKVYDYSIVLPVRCGYMLLPQIGVGITGKYVYTKASFKKTNDFYTYGLFTDYFPLKNKNFFINVSIYNGNVYFGKDSSIVSHIPVYFYSGFGVGYHFKITHYLNFISEVEYLIPLQLMERKPFSLFLGISLIPQNLKKLNRKTRSAKLQNSLSSA